MLPMSQQRAPGTVVRRLAAIAIGATAVLGMAATPALGVEPIDFRDPTPSPRPAPVVVVAPPTPTPAPAPTPPPPVTPTVTPSPTPTPAPLLIGYDVSYPQCGAELPAEFAFAVVGVNGGRVHRPNPCLGPGEQPSQLEWAGRDVQLYANTGNPGPNLSRFWPTGEAGPRSCVDAGWFTGADTHDCAYLYGWNAAADSYRTAVEAFVALGWAEPDAEMLPWPTTWWLDVETANSWRPDRSLNVATLEGARDYLESMEVAAVGFYSTPRLWDRITGGTEAFADHPAWHAGAGDLADAEQRCETEEAFTGGELAMVQWVSDGLDHNIRCTE